MEVIYFQEHTSVHLGYNEIGCQRTPSHYEIFLVEISHFSTKINPVITNPVYNKQKNDWSGAVRYNLI